LKNHFVSSSVEIMGGHDLSYSNVTLKISCRVSRYSEIRGEKTLGNFIIVFFDILSIIQNVFMLC